MADAVIVETEQKPVSAIAGRYQFNNGG